MRIIVTEEQSEWHEYHSRFQQSKDNIFNDLMSHPDFVEDLKNYSYNKDGYTHWWKSSKEDFYEMASIKYCGLFKKVLSKYKLWGIIFKPSNYQDERWACLSHIKWCLDRHFDWLRGNPYEGDDGPIINRSWFGVPDISEYFMETFYGK